MKAKLEALNGKYYGTIINIETDNGATKINIWFMGDYEPSDRQLKEWQFTRKQWDNNKEMGCDSHYESKDGYILAEIICNAINKGGKNG